MTTGSLQDALSRALVTLSDMPDGFAELRSADLIGAAGVDADSFCGSRPRASVRDEVRAAFKGGVLREQRIYHAIATLESGTGATFLDDVRRAAGACLATGSGEVTSVEDLDLADEALRVKSPGRAFQEPHLDYVYFRFGDVVSLVAYAFAAETDPRFTDEFVRIATQRLRGVCEEGALSPSC